MDKLLPELSEPSRQLDVTVLHSLVLERIFGIDKENMANPITRARMGKPRKRYSVKYEKV